MSSRSAKWCVYGLSALRICIDIECQSETRAARGRSVSKVVALFKELDVNVVTKWRTARDLLLDSDEWRSDEELRKLPTLDILLAFEDYRPRARA